jgi:uncharacterized membrane-anchored protein
MTATVRNGLFVALIHVAIVASLGAKLVVDRALGPRVWARAAPVDPNLPIRGRYVSLRLEAAIGEDLNLPEPTPNDDNQAGVLPVALAVRDNQLTAVRPPNGATTLHARAIQRDGQHVAVLNEPLAYFIPEHAPDPSRRAAGEELWVEVTVPRRGIARPIRLGVKRNGVLTPLAEP